jgi:hypothetical protein
MRHKFILPIALAMTSCNTMPALGIDVASACRVWNIVKRTVAPFPTVGSAAAIIEQFVDPVCQATIPIASESETGEWVLHNAAYLATETAQR